MEKQQMLLPGDKLVAGISGGADSVCLLLVLLEWKKRYGLELAVVHVDHGIRAEAAEDARFVEELCQRNGLSFYLCRADVPGLAREQDCSEEEAGRNYRYQSFARVAREFGADRIAVAHNLNDRCETMLFHLFRGSGVKGLAGIPPTREMTQVSETGPLWIIRPLLNIERNAIEEYLAQKGQPFCQDRTNAEDEYTRNRIRHHILSYAEEYIVPGCTARMGQTAELLEETEDYLARQTAAAGELCIRHERSRTDEALSDTVPSMDRCREVYRVDCQVFASLHPAIRKRLMHDILKKLSPRAKDIAQVHVLQLTELLLRSGNRRIDLPFGIKACREYEEVRLWRAEETQGAAPGYDYEMMLQVLSAEDIRRDSENFMIFPENKYTKWFDYDKMKKPPILRTRRSGDYLMIRDADGEIHHKKLKDYMVNEKIPPGQRDTIPVLAEDSHVLWLAGYRISEYYKITDQTRRILQVELKQKNAGDGGQ